MMTASPLIASMLKGFVPMLFKQVAKIPLEEKEKFAGFIADICECFIEGDREQFDELLSKVEIDETWKEALTNALWDTD